MKVREVMTTEIATAEPDTRLEQIATMMRDEDVGAIPVVEDDELLGVVTDRDIVVRCLAAGRDPFEATARDVLSELLEVIEPDADIEEASRLMGQKQIRRLPVVEDGRLVGMLSLGDIAVKESDVAATGKALEEVSRGVKPSRRLGKRSEGRRHVPKGKPAARQGISNRGAREERRRQQRVVPIREKGRKSPRRRAS